MISDLQDSARACLDLVEKHCVRLLREGGPTIHREYPPNYRAGHEERAAAIAVYQQLGSVPAAARAVGRSRDWMRRVVVASGLPMRKPGGKRVKWVEANL